MTTQLIKQGTGFLILHARLTKPTCTNQSEAVAKLKDIGISETEIKDAFASMTANETNAAEFGINNTFIRPFNFSH